MNSDENSRTRLEPLNQSLKSMKETQMYEVVEPGNVEFSSALSDVETEFHSTETGPKLREKMLEDIIKWSFDFDKGLREDMFTKIKALVSKSASHEEYEVLWKKFNALLEKIFPKPDSEPIDLKDIDSATIAQVHKSLVPIVEKLQSIKKLAEKPFETMDIQELDILLHREKVIVPVPKYSSNLRTPQMRRFEQNARLPEHMRGNAIPAPTVPLNLTEKRTIVKSESSPTNLPQINQKVKTSFFGKIRGWFK